MRLFSLQFDDWVQFEIGIDIDVDRWERYAQAAARVLNARFPLNRGLVGVVNGPLVGSGLSSSASVGLAYLKALADVNGVSLSRQDLIKLDQQLENGQLGLQNGLLDQTTIVNGYLPGMLHIETKPNRLSSLRKLDGDFSWLVVSSGQPHSLVHSSYNARVAECLQAAQLLLPGAQRLSDVPEALYQERKAELPEPLCRRAAHYFGEARRVVQGVKAWNAGQMELFGELMDESCQSSLDLYESGSQQLRILQEIAMRTWGVCGSRFCGGGYGALWWC
jgi:galacturonokinase